MHRIIPIQEKRRGFDDEKLTNPSIKQNFDSEIRKQNNKQRRERKRTVPDRSRFDQPDSDWLRFVAQNRKGTYSGPKYDIVCGPVANDNTMPVISDYMSGTINEETALILLKPQKLADQYAFLTSKGLSALSFAEVLKDE